MEDRCRCVAEASSWHLSVIAELEVWGPAPAPALLTGHRHWSWRSSPISPRLLRESKVPLLPASLFCWQIKYERTESVLLNLKQRWADYSPGATGLQMWPCFLSFGVACGWSHLQVQSWVDPTEIRHCIARKVENICSLALYRKSLLALGLKYCAKANCSHELTFCAPGEIPAVCRAEPLLTFCTSGRAEADSKRCCLGFGHKIWRSQAPGQIMKGGGPLSEGLEFLWEHVSWALWDWAGAHWERSGQGSLALSLMGTWPEKCLKIQLTSDL